MKGFGEKPAVARILMAPWLARPHVGHPGTGNVVPGARGEQVDVEVRLARP